MLQRTRLATFFNRLQDVGGARINFLVTICTICEGARAKDNGEDQPGIHRENFCPFLQKTFEHLMSCENVSSLFLDAFCWP